MLLEICAVVATVAFVAIAVVVFRLATRLNAVTLELEESARAFRGFATQAQATGREVQQLAALVREVVPPVRRAAEAFGHVGERAAELGSEVLNEVQGPVRKSMSLVRGVQAGASYFLNRLARNGHREKIGGKSYERQYE